MSGILMNQGAGAPPLNATVYPGRLAKSHSGSGTFETNPATVTAMGGAGGYTYVWAYVSGNVSIRCVAPGSNSTSFTALVSGSASPEALWQCTVTDADGATVSLEVDVSFPSDA
jgi:hypothetical protein